MALPDAIVLFWPFVTASIVSISMYIVINRLRKPKLVISNANDVYHGGHPYHFLHAHVTNRRRRWIGRNPATNCYSQVLFRDKTTGQEFGPFMTKWASKPNPVQPFLSGNNLVLLPNETLIDEARHETIPHGSSRTLDIAGKQQGTNHFLVWVPEVFFQQAPYTLSGQDYDVIARIFANEGVMSKRTFHLRNSGSNAQDLILEG